MTNRIVAVFSMLESEHRALLHKLKKTARIHGTLSLTRCLNLEKVAEVTSLHWSLFSDKPGFLTKLSIFFFKIRVYRVKKRIHLFKNLMANILRIIIMEYITEIYVPSSSGILRHLNLRSVLI